MRLKNTVARAVRSRDWIPGSSILGEQSQAIADFTNEQSQAIASLRSRSRKTKHQSACKPGSVWPRKRDAVIIHLG